MALKQNNMEKLRKQKLLGVPNEPAMTGLLEELLVRVDSYKTHFDRCDANMVADCHETSKLFLQTELDQLYGVISWLKHELETLGVEHSATASKEQAKVSESDNWEL